MMSAQVFQLSPQLASIQTQLRTAIANHQIVFRNYQKDPENGLLKDRLHEMQAQIKILSDHQNRMVEQLKAQLMQNAAASAVSSTTSAPSTSVALAASTAASASASAAPVIVAPSCAATLAKPVAQMAPRPQLVTLSHANVGIVVPFAHLQQAQPTLMTLPGVLNQPSLQTPQSQSIVSLQLNAPITASAAAILTPPTPVNTTSNSATVVTKPSQVSAAPTEVAVAGKPSQSVLRPIQPRPASPPIKVPQYTVNNHSGQGQQSGAAKVGEKTNGAIHRSFSEPSAKDLKGSLDQSEKEKAADDKNAAEKMKLEFMARIGLVTHEASKAIQNKRVERKRRSTANPQYSYTLERRRNGSINNASSSNSWLMGSQPAKRARGRTQRPSPSPGNSCPGSPDSQGISGLDGTLTENKGGRCAECGKEGQLLLCGTCSLMYHLDCLSPPLAAAPESPWSCPACIVSGKSNGLLSNGALSMVNSYITAKANKEDERKKAQRKNVELLQEKQNLQDRKNGLTQKITEKTERIEQLEKLVAQKAAELAPLKAFVKSFQNPPSPAAST
ncbi:uncharacterized protein LOC143301180 isoform X2 [Babylonia areolata]|uniref:uncharacterized protein LOC143301180 isoform X2 n=1 Tax=Babylonia areolata TaxID=304850 RepID=UPI003FD2B9B5